MSRKLQLLITQVFVFIFLFLMNVKTEAQYVHIPDSVFRLFLNDQFPQCMTGQMMDTTCLEIVNATEIYFQGYGKIKDFTGIQYFKNITRFDCAGHGATIIPALPPKLTTFICILNKLITLPELPATLQEFWCYDNQLTSLPNLPPLIWDLRCGSNPLSEMPNLPINLTRMVCTNAQLNSLPNLPQSLQVLDIQGNQLTTLSALPANLRELYCKSNNLTCLPYLPKNLGTLECSGNNITCIPNIPNTKFTSDIGKTVCSALDTNGCTVYPKIAGRIFNDLNGNYIINNGEPGIAGIKVKIQPGDYIVFTDASGKYEIVVDTPKTYIVTLVENSFPYYFKALNTADTIVFTNFGQLDTLNKFPLRASGEIADMEISISPQTPARPGFDVTYHLDIRNKGTITLSGNIEFEFDAMLTYLTSSVATSSQMANLLSWDYNNMKPGENLNIKVALKVPSNMNLGAVLNSYAVVNPLQGDTTASNNEVHLKQIVQGSYDPNDKLVLPEGNVSINDISNQEDFVYTVRFQNTGTDTAFTVKIIDTLSEMFEEESLDLICASHNYKFVMKGSKMQWTFENINLPDSNVNEPESHGFIKYKVKPKSDLILGDKLENTAYIYFDFNEPIVTNTTSNMVSITTNTINSFSRPNVEIYPNPAKEVIRIRNNSDNEKEIKLLNVTGKTIYSSEIDGAYHELDVSELERGIYYLRITDLDNTIYSKMILH